MRVVLDSNIFFSGIFFGGVPGQLIAAAAAEEFVVISSPILVDELLETIRKKTGATLSELGFIEQKVKKMVKLVIPKDVVDVVRDPDDNRVLEAAVAGRCDFIVTGDKDLLTLKEFKGIKILTASDFASWTKPE